jgi:hypothetical protein
VRLSRMNGTGTSRAATYALAPPEAIAEFGRAFLAPVPEGGSAPPS